MSTHDDMSRRRIQVIQVHLSSVPCECVEIATITNAFVHNRIILNGHPAHTRRIDFASLEELAFLDLKMNDAIVLEEANAGDNPEKVEQIDKLKLNPSQLREQKKSLHVFGDV